MDFGNELTPAIRGNRVSQRPASQDLDTWADEELFDSGMVVQPIVKCRQFILGRVAAIHEPPTKAQVLDLLTASRSSATTIKVDYPLTYVLGLSQLWIPAMCWLGMPVGDVEV